jgi:hypothetical protein
MSSKTRFLKRYGVELDGKDVNYEEAYTYLIEDGGPTYWNVLTKAAERGYLPVIKKYFHGDASDDLIEEVLSILIRTNNGTGVKMVVDRMTDMLEALGAPRYMYYEDLSISRLALAAADSRNDEIITTINNLSQL